MDRAMKEALNYKPKTAHLYEPNENIIRFRTSWSPGEPTAVVGFTADIPLNEPIIFTKENNRMGWKRFKLDKP